MGRPWLWFISLLISGLVAPGAGAQVSSQRSLSAYEAERVAAAFELLGGDRHLDLAPEGKTVEAIEVVPLDVIEPTDPAPLLLNWVHFTTRPYVIEREVLLRQGEPFEQSRAYETERNLRLFPQLSVVLVVAAQGSTPDKVRVIVITKDVWSLRLNWNPQFVNGKLTFLSLQPSEINIFGTSRIANLNFILTPDTITTGVGFTDPRVGGSRIQLAVSANAILDCAKQQVEGGTGSLFYGQPLYTTQTKWSWLTYATWSNQVVRVGNGLDPRRVCSEGVQRVQAPELIIADPDNLSEPLIITQDGQDFSVAYPIRNEYRYERLRGQVAITRSYGQLIKYNLSFGAEAQLLNSYTDGFPELSLPAIDVRGGGLVPASPRLAAQRFEELYLPRDGESELRIGPYVQLRTFANRFQRVINLETLGLAEDVRLGHDARLRIYPSLQAAGSTRDVLGLFASASYTAPVHRDGYFESLIAWDSELSTVSAYKDIFRTSAEPAQNRSDATLTLATRFATPSLGIGRFVTDLEYQRRVVRYLRGSLALASTSGLRGYQLCAARIDGIEGQTGVSVTDCFLGDQRLQMNLEFRTRPVQILSTLWGGVLFYDAGDAFNEWKKPPSGSSAALRAQNFNPRSGAGVGLRVLIPQLDRNVFRVDLGFPVNGDDPRGEVSFIAAFGQATFAPFASPDVLLQ